jgi:hypothetical protein
MIYPQLFCDISTHIGELPILTMFTDGDSEELIRLGWVKKECPVLFEGKYGSPQFNIFGPCPEVSTSYVYYADSKLLEHRLSKEWTWKRIQNRTTSVICFIRNPATSHWTHSEMNPFWNFRPKKFANSQRKIFSCEFAVTVIMSIIAAIKYNVLFLFRNHN